MNVSFQYLARGASHPLTKVPEIVVGRLSLWNLAIGLWLAGVDNIRKLHGILNKEDGNVVANNIPVTLFGIKFNSEATNVADCIC